MKQQLRIVRIAERDEQVRRVVEPRQRLPRAIGITTRRDLRSDIGSNKTLELGAACREHALGRAKFEQQLTHRRTTQPGNQGQAQPGIEFGGVSGWHAGIAAARRLIPSYGGMRS